LCAVCRATVARGGSPVYVGLAGPAQTVSTGVFHARPTCSFGLISTIPCLDFMAQFHVEVLLKKKKNVEVFRGRLALGRFPRTPSDRSILLRCLCRLDDLLRLFHTDVSPTSSAPLRVYLFHAARMTPRLFHTGVARSTPPPHIDAAMAPALALFLAQ